MKKFILLGIAASVVIGGATVHAQRIPGKGLQQTAYMKTGQVNNLIGCQTGGCATQPMALGGCAAEPRVSCGAPAPIACCPVSNLKHIPPIIPSVQIPDCASPILAPCLAGGAGKLSAVAESIGRAFARSESRSACKPDCKADCKPDCKAGCKSDCKSGCKPDCVAAAPQAAGECRVMSPGIASLGSGRSNCNHGCDPNSSPCDSGKCDHGRCDHGRGDCRRCDDGSVGSVGSRVGDACGDGVCGNGLCGAGGCCGQFGFPDRGWNMPVKTPITRNPVSYSRYQPSRWYGSPGSGYGGDFPMIYRPTDTTQLGFISHNVPYWRRGRGPGMPAPSAIHSRNCPPGGYTTFGQGYNHNSHQSYPWFMHHMTDANGPQMPAANMAARQPVRRPVMSPRRTSARRPVMQAGFRRSRN